MSEFSFWPYPEYHINNIQPSESEDAVYALVRGELDSLKLDQKIEAIQVFSEISNQPNCEFTRNALEKIRELLRKSSSDEKYDDFRVLVLCCDSISRYPSRKRLSALLKLSYNSVIIENYLASYLSSSVNANKIRKLFFKRFAIKQLELFCKKPKPKISWNETDQSIAEQLWGCEITEDEAWRVSPEISSLSYRMDTEIFNVIYRVSPDTLMAFINNNDRGNSVITGLVGSHLLDDFNFLKKLLLHARPGFERSGKWTGSAIVPFLLSYLVSNFQHVVELYRKRDSDGSHSYLPLDNVYDSLIDVFDILSGRPDFSGIVKRWSPQLMLHIFHEYERFDSSGDQNYRFSINEEILEMLAFRSFETDWERPSWSAVFSWEPWVFQCARAFVLENEDEVHDGTNFDEEWNLSIDDWNSEVGDVLLDKASRFLYAHEGLDAYRIKLLAASLGKNECLDEWFERIWASVYPLRESVEFGFNTDIRINGSLRCSDAGRLLILLFSVCLMRLDLSIGGFQESPNSYNVDDLKKFFEKLYQMTDEMLIIDKFNNASWVNAKRHLIVRRVLFEQNYQGLDPRGISPIFEKHDQPEASDIFRQTAREGEELLTVLSICLKNGIHGKILKAYLSEANIDIESVYDSVMRLAEAAPKKYRFNFSELMTALQ